MNDYALTSFVQKPVCFACDELNSRTRKEAMWNNILEGRTACKQIFFYLVG